MTTTEKHMIDIEKRYFIIDSERLEEVQSKLYGYCVFKDGIIVTLEGLEGKRPEGEGRYVLVERAGNTIKITQDYLGGYGIFLFRNGEKWVLSNNFQYLADYVKGD